MKILFSQLINDIGVDHEYGKLNGKLGGAELSVVAKDGYYHFRAKADLAKAEEKLKYHYLLLIGNELLPIVPVVFVEEINQSLMIYRRKQ